MCGSTGEQQAISFAQQQMYTNLNNNYATTFGQQQDILKAMTDAFTPIFQAGPNQQGMTQAQQDTLNQAQYQTINQQYAQAQRATAQQLAARGGGNALLPSSTTANALAAGTNMAAQNRAAVASNTVNQSYALGRQNWTAATSALSCIAGMTNPLGYAGASTGAGSAAATTANQMAQQSNSIWTGAMGALGSLGSAALGNWGALFPKAASGAMSTIGNTADMNPAFSAYGGNFAPPVNWGSMNPTGPPAI